MKHLFSHAPSKFYKRLAIGATLILATLLPMAASAAQPANVTATTGIANVTAGDTAYKSSVNASYNQVVKVEVTYKNDEAANSNKVANNLRVSINIPSKPGSVRTISTTTSADGADAVTGNVTINLGRADAYLQYIPGSAVWKHSAAVSGQTTQQTISDDTVNAANGIMLENVNPTQAGSVTVLARVMVPGVKITKQVEKSNESGKWASSNTANPGDTLKYLITYQNTGNTTQHNVVIRDSLPAHMTLVSGSTQLSNATYPNGKAVASNNIAKSGIVIGNYAPGANAYITFEVKIAAASQLACGANTFRNVSGAQPEGMSAYYAAAITTVQRSCSTPKSVSPTCNALTISKKNARTITAQVAYAANGATLKTIRYDFGDGSTPLTTNKSTVTYTYAKDGDYTVVAAVTFTVNGKDQTVDTNSCTQSVIIAASANPTTPKSPKGKPLPGTGPGNVIGLFIGTTAFASVGYWLVAGRRFVHR